MMIRIRWKLTMMLIPEVFMVFVFHKKEGQGVTFSLSLDRDARSGCLKRKPDGQG